MAQELRHFTHFCRSQLVGEGHASVCLEPRAVCFPNKFSPTGVRRYVRHLRGLIRAVGSATNGSSGQ
jgi:hypothetical protein